MPRDFRLHVLVHVLIGTYHAANRGTSGQFLNVLSVAPALQTFDANDYSASWATTPAGGWVVVECCASKEIRKAVLRDTCEPV